MLLLLRLETLDIGAMSNTFMFATYDGCRHIGENLSYPTHTRFVINDVVCVYFVVVERRHAKGRCVRRTSFV